MLEALEDALLARCKQVLGDAARTIDTLPGPLNVEALRQSTARWPAVFSQFVRLTPELTRATARWSLYVVTAHAQNARARQVGDVRAAGVYALGEALVLGLQSWADVSCRVLSMDNLWTEELHRQGWGIVGLTLELDGVLEQAPIADALTRVQVEYELNDGTPAEKTDTIELEQ